MTLFELLFFIFIVTLASMAGMWGYSYGGFWIGIICVWVAVPLIIGTLVAMGELSARLHQAKMKRKETKQERKKRIENRENKDRHSCDP